MDTLLASFAERVSRYIELKQTKGHKHRTPNKLTKSPLTLRELTARLSKPHGIRVAHKPASTLLELVSIPTRPTEMFDQTQIVYKVHCANCEKFYVGQTGGNLKLECMNTS